MLVTLIYLVHSTGQNLLPRGKGHNRTSRSLTRCPTLPTPHLHTKDSHSTEITLKGKTERRTLTIQNTPFVTTSSTNLDLSFLLWQHLLSVVFMKLNCPNKHSRGTTFQSLISLLLALRNIHAI